jgi:hypothetical protein
MINRCNCANTLIPHVPGYDCPADVMDPHLITLIKELGGAKLMSHSERTLLDHLVGTWRILHAWELPPHICRAGLIHSVYSTVDYRPALFGLDKREALRKLAGGQAEELAFLFCTMDRSILWRDLSNEATFKDCSIPVVPADLVGETIAKLLIIECANFAEQTCADDGLPAPWMSWLLSWRKHIATSQLRPSFCSLTGGLTWGADEYACELYRCALTPGGPERREFLLETIRYNPHAAEPRILLAADYVEHGKVSYAKREACAALGLISTWRCTWDKRMLVRDWFSEARNLAENCESLQGRPCLNTLLGKIESRGGVATIPV